MLIRKIREAKSKCVEYSQQNRSVWEDEPRARRRDLSIRVGGMGDVEVSGFLEGD